MPAKFAVHIHTQFTLGISSFQFEVISAKALQNQAWKRIRTWRRAYPRIGEDDSYEADNAIIHMHAIIQTLSEDVSICSRPQG